MAELTYIHGDPRIDEEGTEMFDTLVRGGQVVCAGNTVEAEVGIKDGRIAALLGRGVEARANQVIDASDKVVIPGVIDAHFHFSMASGSKGDSFETSAISAAYGGVTTLIPFIEVPPDAHLGEFLDSFLWAGGRTSVLDFAMHCWPHAPDRRRIAQIPDAIALGVTSFKAFMAYR